MSSLNVGYISTGRAYTSLVEVSSLNVGFLSSGQTVGGPAQLISLSTNTISSGSAFIGRLGVNVSSAQYSLDVGGSAWVRSTLYVGYDLSTNQIRFYGTTLDGPGQTSSSFTHTVIGEYLYEAPEKSELLIYKGNDTGAGASGPDRVRVLASGGFKVDTGVVGSWPEGGAPPSTITYENALFVSGTNGRVGINTSTPSQTLDVNGSLVSRVTTALGESATLFNDDSSQRYMEHRGPRGAYIDFCAGGTDYNLRVGYFSTSYAEIRTDSSSSASTIALMPKEGTGRVGINTTTPSQTLEVNGSVWARSTLYVGSNSVTNQIRFYGTNDDGQGNFNRTVIGEYLYGGSEQSELILFKGDDATSAAGPDRVRVLAAGGFKVDVGAGVGTWPEGGAPPTAPYQNALFVSGTDGNVSIAQNLTVSGSITTNGGYNLSNSAQSAVMRFLTQGGESFIQSGSNTTSGSENKLYFTNYGWSGTALTTMDFVNDRVGILAQTPTETLDVNGVLNLRAGTVQGYPVVEAANKTNTYAVFADAGTGGTDWAFLRQIGVTNQYHMALDLHDDANDGKFSIRNVASSGTGTDTVRTLFKVDGSNNRVGIMTDDPQYTLDVSGNMRVTGSLSLNTATFSNIAAINTSTCTLEVTKLNSPQLWVAVGMDVTPNNTIKYSSDGFSWNNSSGSGFTTSGDGIGWNGQMWVAVGTDSTPNNTIKYSYNGINWVNSSSGGFTNAGYDVAWNGQMWVAVGWDQTQNNTIKYSYDGINWSNSSGPGFNTGGFNGNFGIGIAWNGKMWLAFGVDLTPNNTIKYSYDGINWSNSSSGGFTYSGYNAAWNGQMWVAVGSSAPNTTIKYSYNGINWFNSINTFSAWGEDVAWNGKMWVAVGNDTTQNNTIKYSSDGINWFNSLGSGFRYIGSGIAWNGQLWVAVGTDTSFNNTIKYSSDGIFWFNSYGSVFGSSALAITYSTQLTPDIKTQNLDIYSQNVPVFQNTKNKIFGLQNGISIPGSLDVNDIRFASYGMTVNLLRYIPLAWMANGGAGDRTAGCPMMYTGAGNKVVFTSNADNSADGYLLGPRAYIKIYDDTSVLRYTFSNLSTENWIFEYAINPVNTNYYYECYLF
jgi:hypothetical protein